MTEPTPRRRDNGQVIDCRKCTDQIFGACAEHAISYERFDRLAAMGAAGEALARKLENYCHTRPWGWDGIPEAIADFEQASKEESGADG